MITQNVKNDTPYYVIIGPAHPLRGGLAAFNERMARALLARGHRVKIITFSLQYPSFLFPGKSQITDAAAPNDLDIEVLINSINPISWWQTGRYIAKLRPDIVICRFWLPFMGPALGSVLRLVRRNTHSRIIGLIDNIIPHEKRIGDHFLAQYFVGACHRFVVLARAVEAEMKQFTTPEQTIAYTPHPIYDHYGGGSSRRAALQHLGLPESGRYVLFFGFVRKYKGLDLLLNALADKQLAKLGVRLIVAGEFYEDEANYRQIIANLGISDGVTLFSDYISDDEVGVYFSAADLVVQPYRTATQSGISQIAYHFGKPMVVTNVGGLPEIVPHGKAGYVVAPEPADIAAAIADFFENHRAAELSIGVIEQQKRFSWDTFCEVVEQLGEIR